MSYRRRHNRRARAVPLVPANGTVAGVAEQPQAIPAAAAPAPITVRVGNSEQDAADIHYFMLHNAIAEMAEASVDSLVYMQTVWNTVVHGAALMAFSGEQLVGYLGIVRSQFSYSRECFLHDTEFYVLPEHRGGKVTRDLLAEARGIADEARMILKIRDTNPTRKRPVRGRAITAEVIGYRPQGRVFSFYPKAIN